MSAAHRLSPRPAALWLWLGLGLVGAVHPQHAAAGPGPGVVDGRSHAGVAAAAVVPAGDWADVAGPGGGAAAWLEVPISPRLAVTALAGVTVHAPATVTAGARLTLIEVPVLGGARLELVRAGRLRVTAGVDLGLVVAHERVSLGGVTAGDTSLRFGGALLVGVAFDRVGVVVGPWLADLPALDQLGAQLTLTVRLRSW